MNLVKSHMFCSSKVTSARRERFVAVTSIQFTNDLGKYLRVRLFAGRPKKECFQPILDKVDQRLPSWKMKLPTSV